MNRILKLFPAKALLGWLIVLLATTHASTLWGQQQSRIWVDAQGLFSIQAILLNWTEDDVVLLRQDGGEVSIPLSQLSNLDQKFVEEAKAKAGAGNQLRLRPPEPPNIKPLQPLRLPPSNQPADDHARLTIDRAETWEPLDELPQTLPADRAHWSFDVPICRIPIEEVDFNSEVSLPMPYIATTSMKKRTVSLAMSISDPVRMVGAATRQQLVSFDTEHGKARVRLEHDETIRLLDHDPHTNRSLVLVGFNSLGEGGEVAIASGWNQQHIRLSRFRKIDATADPIRSAKLRWARWVDEQHVFLVFDDSIGLWNLISGEQIHHIGGLDPRTDIAISGGRRYIAIPYNGGVDLLSMETGAALGRIRVEAQVPGVSFSPLGNSLAITTSRRLRVWDLPAADLSHDIESRRIFGTKSPIWIDSDLILSGNGVLVSLFRGLPIWKYEIAGTEIAAIGDKISLFEKSINTQLSIVKIPHTTSRATLQRIEDSPIAFDREHWRVPGRSVWDSGHWVDRDVRISAKPQAQEELEQDSLR